MAAFCLSRHAIHPFSSSHFRFSLSTSSSSGFPPSFSSLIFPRVIHCRRMRVHSFENEAVPNFKNPIKKICGGEIVENEGVPNLKNPIKKICGGEIEIEIQDKICGEIEEIKDKICGEIEEIEEDFCGKEDFWSNMEKDLDLKEKKEEQELEKKQEQNEEDAKKFIWKVIWRAISICFQICFKIWKGCCRIWESIHNRIWIWKMKQQSLETMMVHEKERSEREMAEIVKTTKRHLAERKRLARMIEMSNTQAMKEAKKAQKELLKESADACEQKQKFLIYLTTTFSMVSTFLAMIISFISVYENIMKQEQLLQCLVVHSSTFLIWFLAMWKNSSLFKWVLVFSCLSLFFIWFLAMWKNWMN